MRMTIEAATLDLSDVRLGDSIAVSGACLTVVQFDTRKFEVDVSPETRARTGLGQVQVGGRVNLEKALRLSDRLGGHLVTGHVDGIGEIVARANLDNCVRFVVRAPAPLAHYFAAKGSVCIDGVSLTVNAVDGAEFELLIIPHTLRETTLGGLQAGSRVNLEIDLIARYLERLLSRDAAVDLKPGRPVALETLRAAGFVDR